MRSDSPTTATAASTAPYHALPTRRRTHNSFPNLLLPNPPSPHNPKPMASGASPFPPTPAPATAPRKSNPGSTWTDQETAHLLDVYEERWNSVKRGQLKAQQWEDVSAEIAARCYLSPPSKNGTQCRHKIEKLRKRYRSERLRPFRSSWPFFDRIDRMECGPISISAARPPSSDDSGEPRGSHTRSISGILRDPAPWENSRVPVNLEQRKRRFEERDEDEEDDDEEDNSEEGEGGDGVAEIAIVLRNLGDGYVKMERRRMEIVREIELEKMEMEAKKMEMIMEAQRCLVETIAGLFSKKAKNSVEM